MTTLIDPTIFETLKQTVGEDFIAELIDAYLSDSPNLIATMRQSLKEGKADTFRNAAHSLKSNSANLGAQRLAELARDLEMLGKAGNLENTPAMLAQLEEAYRPVADELQRRKN
jgi:two-component system, sensor histidine kinase and response regulator